MSETNGDHARLEKSIDALVVNVSSLSEKQGQSNVVLARIDERVKGLQGQGCSTGERWVREIHRRLDLRRNVTGIGTLIAGAVAGVVAWVKGGG